MNEELFNKIKDKMEKEVNNKAFNLFMNNFVYTETFLRTICVFITIFAQALVIFVEYSYVKSLCAFDTFSTNALIPITLLTTMAFITFNLFIAYSTSKNIIAKYIKGFKNYCWNYDSTDYILYQINLFIFVILSMFWLNINIFVAISLFIIMCCVIEGTEKIFKSLINFLERRN